LLDTPAHQTVCPRASPCGGALVAFCRRQAPFRAVPNNSQAVNGSPSRLPARPFPSPLTAAIRVKATDLAAGTGGCSRAAAGRGATAGAFQRCTVQIWAAQGAGARGVMEDQDVFERSTQKNLSSLGRVCLKISNSQWRQRVANPAMTIILYLHSLHASPLLQYPHRIVPPQPLSWRQARREAKWW
jgi:hypothetical protein